MQESQSNDLIDAIIIVDDSESISDRDFQTSMVAASYLVDAYSTASSVKFSVIKFSTRIEKLIVNTEHPRIVKNLLQDYIIAAKPREKGYTHTREALFAAVDIFNQHSRHTSNKVVFLITDGKSNYGDPTEPSYYLKFAHNAIVFAIGIGNQINENELQYVASVGHYFKMENFDELLQSVRKFAEKSINSQREVVFKTFITTPLVIGQDIPLRITISNISPIDISEGSYLRISASTDYLTVSTVNIDKPIPAHGSIEVTTKLPASGSADVKNLPEYIEIEMRDSDKNTVFTKTGKIALATDYFTLFCPWGNQEKSGQCYCPINRNILIFGCIGSGKTSWINSLQTAVARQIQRVGLVGSSAPGHSTQHLVRYDLSENIQKISKISIKLWDTWGVTPENYEKRELLPAILDGQLPNGYHMLEQTSLHVYANVSEDHITESFDSVLIFVPWNIKKLVQLVERVQNLSQAIRQKEYNILVVVTHIDEAENSGINLSKLRKDIAELFLIPANMVHLVSNYVEEVSKNFTKDKTNLIIFDEVLRLAENRDSYCCDRDPKSNCCKICTVKFEDTAQNITETTSSPNSMWVTTFLVIIVGFIFYIYVREPQKVQRPKILPSRKPVQPIQGRRANSVPIDLSTLHPEQRPSSNGTGSISTVENEIPAIQGKPKKINCESTATQQSIEVTPTITGKSEQINSELKQTDETILIPSTDSIRNIDPSQIENEVISKNPSQNTKEVGEHEQTNSDQDSTKDLGSLSISPIVEGDSSNILTKLDTPKCTRVRVRECDTGGVKEFRITQTTQVSNLLEASVIAFFTNSGPQGYYLADDNGALYIGTDRVVECETGVFHLMKFTSP